MSTQIPEALEHLLQEQWLGTLSTQQQGQPYASLVGFACSEDRRMIWFATPRATRKFSNLRSDSRAAMLIDSRTNTPEDFRDACACTAVGSVSEPQGEERRHALKQYIARLPQLRQFVEAPSCALLQLNVANYVIVCRFQQVTEYSP